jgi:hypothetical protein
LLALPNVFHVDTRHPDELRHIIRGARAGLVAYAFEPRQKAESSPSGSLKILSYLAQGRPVVCSINSYLPELDGRSVFKAENEKEFIEIVADVVSGKLKTDTDTVPGYLDRVTYDRLTASILEALP